METRGEGTTRKKEGVFRYLLPFSSLFCSFFLTVGKEQQAHGRHSSASIPFLLSLVSCEEEGDPIFPGAISIALVFSLSLSLSIVVRVLAVFRKFAVLCLSCLFFLSFIVLRIAKFPWSGNPERRNCRLSPSRN